MVETWKDIPGYEGWYQVSNLGNVRSVDRMIEQWSRYGHTITRNLKGKMITSTDNGNGYKIVGLKKNQVVDSRYVHRLVAEAFIPNPDGKLEINHKDFNKANNSVDNLEWVTRVENVNYSHPHMCKPRTRCKPTNTGEKYIRHREGRYCLYISRQHIYKSFATLEDAKAARAVMIGW